METEIASTKLVLMNLLNLQAAPPQPQEFGEPSRALIHLDNFYLPLSHHERYYDVLCRPVGSFTAGDYD